ncbi:MAG: acyl-CoA dehydrogenase [Pseudomonadota bacterium]
MTDQLIDERDLKFILYEVLKVEDLCRYAYFEDHSQETFDLTLEAALKLARGVYWPAYVPGDRQGVRFDGRTTQTPEGVKKAYQAAVEGGWVAPSAPYEYGGQQLPNTISVAVGFILNAANIATHLYVGGSSGTGHLLQSFAGEKVQALFMKKLYAGQWAGTMALTEPQAGSSLADIKTTAVKVEGQDYYLINGTKCFITSGDHDLTENIVHLTLARIKGAPAGVKGISLMAVPKYRPKEDGSAGEFNDVTTVKIEEKMGLHAQATAMLNFGENNDCRGWLVGEENKGLSYMFQMMNEARIFTGLQAVSLASCAYQQALEYSRQRLQGRPILEKDPGLPQVPIIRHADVRRMLLAQKSYIEGVISLVLYAAYCWDMIQVLGRDSKEGAGWQDLIEILTPVCKAYGSDISFESIRLALQCFGGYGYCQDYVIEQLLRDCKVFSIYEGTNSIQALDLLGRKAAMKNGAAFKAVLAQIDKSLDSAREYPGLADMAAGLESAKKAVAETTAHLINKAVQGEVELFLANATIYLEMFSQTVVAWQHLLRSIAAEKALQEGRGPKTFYRGKLESARYFFNQVLPHALTTARILQADDRTALDMPEDCF